MSGVISSLLKNLLEAANPGYNTHLYNAIGCALDTYDSIDDVFFFILSDGGNRNSKLDIYSSAEIRRMIQAKRNQNWIFKFMGAVTRGRSENELRKQVQDMGFNDEEIMILSHQRTDSAAKNKIMKKGLKKMTKTVSDHLFN